MIDEVADVYCELCPVEFSDRLFVNLCRMIVDAVFACQKAGVDAGSYESMYVWSFDYFQTSSVDYNRFSMKYDYAFCLGHPNS